MSVNDFRFFCTTLHLPKFWNHSSIVAKILASFCCISSNAWGVDFNVTLYIVLSWLPLRIKWRDQSANSFFITAVM